MEPIGESLADKILRDMLVPKNQTQDVNINYSGSPPPPPSPPWHAYVGAAGAIVCVLLTGFALIQASDAKAEVRALRIEYSQRLDAAKIAHEADVRELRQKDGALQAYINAGKVPAQPRK
jgi:hypothetical protein